MKTTTTLLAALGLAMPAAFAQMQSEPQLPSVMESQPGTGIQPPAGPSSDLSSGGVNGMKSEAGMDLPPAPPMAQGPVPQTQNDVTYMCGGVGVDEAAFMKQAAKDYDMMLTFAARDGSYLADVNVEIMDTKGNSVLQAKCDGPLMLVDLPTSGNYRVRADAAGYTLNRTVKVAAGEKKGQRLTAAVLSWPQRVMDVGGPAETATGSGSTGRGASGQR